MSDYRVTTGEELPLSKIDQRRKRWRVAGFVTIALLLIVAVTTLIEVDLPVLASGHVTTRLYAQVRPAVQGTITEILAWSGDDVEGGETLVRLDDTEQQTLLNEAVSRKNKVAAELSRRQATIAQEQKQRAHEVGVLKLRLEHATANVKLVRELKEKGLASGNALEDARLSERLAHAELNALLEFDKTLPEKELAVLRKELEAAEEAVTRAQARLDARRVCAPLAGKVLRYGFVVGELVGPESVLYEVFGGNGRIMKLRVPERDAAKIAPGQPYRATLRPFSRGVRPLWFTGHVEKTRNVIQTENKKSYRVVYCSFDARGYPVPPGTTAEARISIGKGPLWARVLGLY